MHIMIIFALTVKILDINIPVDEWVKSCTATGEG